MPPAWTDTAAPNFCTIHASSSHLYHADFSLIPFSLAHWLLYTGLTGYCPTSHTLTLSTNGTMLYSKRLQRPARQEARTLIPEAKARRNPSQCVIEGLQLRRRQWQMVVSSVHDST